MPANRCCGSRSKSDPPSRDVLVTTGSTVSVDRRWAIDPSSDSVRPASNARGHIPFTGSDPSRYRTFPADQPIVTKPFDASSVSVAGQVLEQTSPKDRGDTNDGNGSDRRGPS